MSTTAEPLFIPYQSWVLSPDNDTLKLRFAVQADDPKVQEKCLTKIIINCTDKGIANVQEIIIRWQPDCNITQIVSSEDVIVGLNVTFTPNDDNLVNEILIDISC
jgi:hypothetical protein